MNQIRVRDYAFVLATIITGLLSTAPCVSAAAERPDVASVNEKYAALIAAMIRHIEWPSQQQEKDFVIAVVGNKELSKILSVACKDKWKNKKKIVVRYFDAVTHVSNTCPVVFLDASRADALSSLVQKSNSTLIISNKPGLGKLGSCINFLEKENKIHFEINRASLSRARLRIAISLLDLGIVLD
jgi:hypothetical protein